jgi:Protein of unknown function (DUF3575).
MKHKKIIFSIGFAIGLSALSLTSFGQKTALKINIFSPLVKTLNLSLEQKINATHSGQVGFFTTGVKFRDTEFRGFGITAEFRFYLLKAEAIRGFYVAPFFRYQDFKLEDVSTNSKGEITPIGGGFTIGKQWVFKERISLDVFLGPAYYSGEVNVTSGTNSFDIGALSGFTVRPGLTFGIAF